MAVRESLEFDLRGALQQLDQLERQIDDLSDPRQLRLDVSGDAAQEIRTIDERLDDLVNETKDVNVELSRMDEAAERAVVDFSKLAKEMGISEERARDVAREIEDASRASTRLETEARSVARAMGLSEAEASKFTAELHRADRAAEAIDVTAVALPGRFTAVRNAAAGITAALAGIGGAAVLGGAVRAANAAVQSFAQLEDSVNAVNVVFGTGAEKVLEFGENAARSAGLSETAFNQAVVPIGSLLQNFGFDAAEASEAAVILVQRAADLASVMGGTVQEALLAVGAALRGEADPLERYGASVSAARVEQFALANELARTKAEITPAITLQARYGLILSDTARVQGDYANTAGDLANLQRSAAAEAANFGNDLGEVLAPAMEEIVALLPDMLEGLRLLVPGFAAAADSAADFFQSMGEGGGFRTEFAVIEAGFDAVTTGGGLFFEAVRFGVDLFQGDLKGAGDSVTRLSGLFARSLTRGIAINFANELDKGTDAVDAFTDAVEQVGGLTTNFDTFKDSYREFAIGAGLSQEQLRGATIELLTNADALGFNAQEIQFLNEQLTQLNGLLAVDTRRRGPFEGLDDIPFESITTKFTTFTGALDEARTAAEEDLKAIADVAAAQAQRTADAFDLFADQPEKLTESFNEGVQALRESVLAQRDFDINIALLRALNLDALADDFQRLGVGAADQLIEALNDIPTAIEANRLAQGFADLGEEAFNALVDKFIAAGLTPSDARKLADSVTGIVTPDVIAAGEKAGGRIGAATAEGTITGFREALIEEGEMMDTARIEAAIDARVEESFTADDQAEYAATATVTAWEVAAIEAAEALSGATLQARLGDLFSDINFVISADQFQFPTSFSGVMDLLLHPTAVVSSGTSIMQGGGVSVVNNIYNPTTTDLPTNVAQANQSTSAVANLFNRVQD